MTGTPDLKPGDILLYKGKGFTSRIIQLFTGSDYNHVAVVLEPKVFLSVESNTGHQAGVRAVDLRKIDFKEVDVYRIKPEFTYDLSKVVSFLVGHLGAKYDLMGVVFLGFLKILSLFTFLTWKPFNTFQIKKDYFCSELVYEAFATGGLDIVPQVDSADVTSPGDISESPLLIKIESSVLEGNVHA